MEEQKALQQADRRRRKAEKRSQPEIPTTRDISNQERIGMLYIHGVTTFNK
jgi:hypothetical protein